MQHPPEKTGQLPRSPALRVLIERGYVHQCTNPGGFDAALEQAPMTIYSGFDATGDSLHVGHLLPIMALRHLQQAGHKPIILLGGGTTRVGDPSFRSEARPMLSDTQIAHNIDGLRQVFGRFLRIGTGPTDAMLVNNADWLDTLAYVSMLREVGRHFSVNRMLAFDSVRTRLERHEGLSLLEFNYMVLQAYDFLELSRSQACRAQIGGSDQWGNIVSGVDLVRRVTGQEVFGLTVPLLTTAAGIKMGKTAAGAVWLNAARLAPYDYWQFWRNTEDADVGRFLRLLTDLPLAQIAAYEAGQGTQLNYAKHVLADHATALAHGVEAARAAARTAAVTFGGRSSFTVLGDSAGLAAAEAAAAGDTEADADPSADTSTGLPRLPLTSAEWGASPQIVELLVRSGLATSKTAARRLIEGRGVRLDGALVSLPDARLQADGKPAVRLSAGRKRHVVIERV